MGNIDRYPTYKGGKVTEVVVYANYIGLRRFYRYVVDIGRWSPYEGGQLDRFHCISFVMSVCLSVRMEQFGSHWMDFHEILYLSIFRKTADKCLVSLIFDNNNGTLPEDTYTFLITSRSVLFRMRNVSDKFYRGNQNTHFMFNNFFSKIVLFMR